MAHRQNFGNYTIHSTAPHFFAAFGRVPRLLKSFTIKAIRNNENAVINDYPVLQALATLGRTVILENLVVPPGMTFMLQMQDIDMENRSTAVEPNVNFQTFGVDTLMELFDRVVSSGSTPELEIWDVEFIFLTNYQDLISGRGTTDITKVDGLRKLTRTNYYYKNNVRKINFKYPCALFAIMVDLIFKGHWESIPTNWSNKQYSKKFYDIFQSKY